VNKDVVPSRGSHSCEQCYYLHRKIYSRTRGFVNVQETKQNDINSAAKRARTSWSDRQKKNTFKGYAAMQWRVHFLK